MKKILYIASLFLLLASCDKEQDAVERTAGVPLDVSIQLRTKGGDDADHSKPVVNSVRLLAFAGESGSETCVLNRYSPFGFTVTEGTDSWVVSMKSNLVISGSKALTYKMYAVLNEGGYMAGSGSTLTSVLNEVGASTTISAFETIAATPVQYSAMAVGKSEPAFLMFAKKNVTFSDFEAPVSLVFDANDGGTAPERSMAEIYIDKITSQPVSGHTSGTDLPKVFVLGVWIDNVPAGTAWGSAGAIGTDPVSIKVGAANEETGYYDRTWKGSVTGNIVVNATRTQLTSAKYWRTGSNAIANNQQTTDWSFMDDSFVYHVDYTEPVNPGPEPNNPPKVNEPNSKDKKYKPDGENSPLYQEDLAAYNEYLRLKGIHDAWVTANTEYQNALAQAIVAKKASYTYAVAGKNKIDHKYENSNSVVALVNSMSGQFTDDLVTNTQFVNNRIVTTGAASDVTASSDYWTVKIDEGYYVPENIAASATAATKIRVRVAVAHPTLSATSIELADLPDTPSAFMSEPTSGFTYTLDGYDLTANKINYLKADGTYEKDKDKWVPQVFLDNAHVVYFDDLEYEVVKPEGANNDWYDDHNGFKTYVDGFGSIVSGNGYVQITDKTNNAGFSWGLPEDLTDAANYVDLTIPVGDDFCVRRNTRYIITLHMDNSSWSNNGLNTKSSADSGFGITATVKTEKISEDEK